MKRDMFMRPGRCRPRYSRLGHFAVACVLLLTACQGLAAQDFVTGTDAIPLMPGLENTAAEGVVFDSPFGRIVEAEAEGAVAPQAVRAFYAQTLPQLGWEPAGPDTFVREGDQLVLEITQADGGTGGRTHVLYRIGPQPGAQPEAQ